MSTNIMGIGVDIESVERFSKHMDQGNQAFFDRLFHPDEISYCQAQNKSALHYAARFCAKEALVKAAGMITPMLVTDFAIGRHQNGCPYVFYWQRAARSKEIFATMSFMISLSHTSSMAMAYATLVQEKDT